MSSQSQGQRWKIGLEKTQHPILQEKGDESSSR